MIYRDEKRRLYKQLVRVGAKRPEVAAIARDANVAAPQDLISKWEDRFYSNPIETYPTEPRLVNRFCVGADPEFVFVQVDRIGGIKYKHASELGLNTVDAFGSDMSGRQAELRAYPSRFVLEVVSSLVDTLRWMNQIHKLDNIQWIAPARFGDDGVGGHVHFGRKRPDLNNSIASLDSVTQLLLAAGVLDKQGQSERIIKTAYGRYGDWRPQTHGYEYRTMPSWMTSPWAAYFTLVVSKLAVLEDIREFMNNKRPVETLVNLLRAYKSRDDDARIALLALEKHGFPAYQADDFKKRWGVGASEPVGAGNYYIPPVIEPCETTNRQLFHHLVSGKPMLADRPDPSWEPFLLPKDIYKPDVQAHVYGVSDIAQGLLTRGCMTLFRRAERNALHIVTTLPLDLIEIQKECQKYPAIKHWTVRKSAGDKAPVPRLDIYVPGDIYNNDEHAVDKEKRSALRAVLTESGLFPFMKYKDWAKPAIERAAPVKKKYKPIGKVLVCVDGEGQEQEIEA